MNQIFNRGLLLAGVSAIAFAAASNFAYAQSVDYGALEQLYGEPVTTSATGKPQKVSEVPANMEIITQDDIRRSGADNIPDILQFVTGVSVRRNAFADAAVSVRGYAQAINPRLLVLLNGRQVYVDDYGYVPWETIPVALDEIRQIEIVKGPNSALFGFNAVAGVINIITYDPLFDSFDAGTARFGSQKLTEGSLVDTVHIGDSVGVKVTAGGYLAHEFSDPYPSPKLINPTQGYLNADGKYRVAPGVIVSLSASSVTANNIADSSIGSLLQRYYRTNSVSGGISADTPVGTLSLLAYRNELNFDSASGTTATTNFWTNVVYVVQANDLVRINDANTIRVGIEYRDNSLEAPVFVANTIGYQVWSGSAMWDWQINPQLSLTNAVRFDHLAMTREGTALTGDGYPNSAFDRSISEVSFNSGLVYRPTEVDTIRLTVARGVQVPSLLQFGVTTGANPNLDPTIVTNYEADYDRAVPVLNSLVRAALFYQTNTDLLVIGNAGPLVIAPNGKLTKISNNIGSSDELGLEIGIKGHSESGFRWNLSYTFSSVTEDVTSNLIAKAPDTPFDYMRGTPVHTVDLGIGYSIEKWEFDAQAKWQSQFRDYISINNVLQQPKLISDYITATARVGYRLSDKVILAVSAVQFNQENVASSAALQTQRRIIASVTAKF